MSAETVLFTNEIELGEHSDPYTWRYDGEIGLQHVNPALLPPSTSNFVKEHFEISDGQNKTCHSWRTAPSYEHGKDAVDLTHNMTDWIDRTIQEIPGGMELAWGVDGGGYTYNHAKPSLFTRWVSLGTGETHVRFSQARSAGHNSMTSTKGYEKGGLLRSTLDGAKVVLEATGDPESVDPRDAVTLLVYKAGSGSDPKNRLVYGYEPTWGALHDMT